MPEPDSISRWKKLEELFHAARATPSPDREKLLDRECAQDPELRREVVAMLQSTLTNDSFLEVSPLATPQDSDCPWLPSLGETIDHYRIVREIGSGGMGRVYLAARSDDFEKLVAIKFLRAGVDSEALIARFRMERQILAALEHPNIARLLDGGTTRHGFPYLVMEYIEGVPVTDYCDRHKLTVDARLNLFLPICDAVQHAHKNLVVHRDIKPSNILVTKDGVPKLLDFGIAKLLDRGMSTASLPTLAEGRAMTPEYASPEQILGAPITTATDSYSLGVVLYELLTGHALRRFTRRTLDELVETVRNVEPARPSTVVNDTDASARNTQLPKLRRLLEGDLDNILLHALQKEPQGRYNSVEQFADDIRRYQKGFPVFARKETFIYRASKFVRRNKAQVAAGLLLVFSLAGGIAGTTWEARRADRRFRDVRKLAGSVLFELYDEIARLPGSTHARELVVKHSLEYLDSLGREANGDKALQLELAAAYERIGTIQWDRFFGNLGDRTGAVQSQQKALDIRQAVVQANQSDRIALTGLASSYIQVGDLEVEQGDPHEGLADFERATAIRKRLVSADPKDWAARRFLAASYMRIGDVKGSNQVRNLGDTAGALEAYQKMRDLYVQLAAEQPDNDTARNGIAIGYQRLAYIKEAQGDLPEALQLHKTSVEIVEQNVRLKPSDIRWLRNLQDGYVQIGSVQAKMGDYRSAMESFTHSVELGGRLAAMDPENYGAARDLRVSLAALSKAAGNDGQKAVARDAAQRRIAIDKSWAERPNATAMQLNEYASDLLRCDIAELRQPQTALGFALRAKDASGLRDPNILDTLALAYFMNGDRSHAAATERAAINASADRADLRKTFEDSFRKYQSSESH